MENHGVGTHNDKMCADSSTGNTQNTSQFILAICPNQPIIWDIFEKGPHHMSIVHARLLKPIHKQRWPSTTKSANVQSFCLCKF